MTVAEVAAYIARQQGIPDAQQRYIHSFRSSEGKRIFIGAHPPLLSRIHHLRTLDFDTSFKPVQGKLQIFEINGFLASHARGEYLAVPSSDSIRVKCLTVITVLHVWMDVHDRVTFEIVWSDVFGLILSLTGHPLRFKELHTGGKLLGINSDMEAAPLLAFADAIWKTMSNARRVQIGDPEFVLLYVLVVCKVHYNRGINDGLKHLPSGAGSESDLDASASEDDSEDAPNRTQTLTRRRLRGLRHFHSQQQIDGLEADILASGDHVLIEWWKQKKMHHWLLPGLIAFLYRINPDDWHLIPASTNIGEGQHRWNNIHTGTAMGIIESMQKYEQLDIEVEADLEQAAITGDLRNMQNNPVDRYAKRNSRNLATVEGAQRKCTKDQNSKTSGPEKATATETVQLLKAELDVAKSKLAQAKAEVNSNSSGRVRPPRPGRSSVSAQVQPAPAPLAPTALATPPTPPLSTSAVLAAAPVSAPVMAERDDAGDVPADTRRSARKRVRAGSSVASALPSTKRTKPPVDPLAGWLMKDPDTGEQLTGEAWVKRYPEEFAKRYPRDHRHYLEYIQFNNS
ncbi:hypothetical protein GGX14DRAFT_603962 [Mycena pura]|uniref:Uncharacterized protein n=1 Tax=Mycena pura TaxID=153505 RepID=A0AAD6Y1T6_9AGAR|nr:hypothetical protein GGX14DRAFT_603962 [Mycena pura]